MNRLQSELRRIDHRGYPAYKDLRGSYDFGKYILNIEHIQGDPFVLVFFECEDKGESDRFSKGIL